MAVASASCFMACMYGSSLPEDCSSVLMLKWVYDHLFTQNSDLSLRHSLVCWSNAQSRVRILGNPATGQCTVRSVYPIHLPRVVSRLFPKLHVQVGTASMSSPPWHILHPNVHRDPSILSRFTVRSHLIVYIPVTQFYPPVEHPKCRSYPKP